MTENKLTVFDERKKLIQKISEQKREILKLNATLHIKKWCVPVSDNCISNGHYCKTCGERLRNKHRYTIRSRT